MPLPTSCLCVIFPSRCLFYWSRSFMVLSPRIAVLWIFLDIFTQGCWIELLHDHYCKHWGFFLISWICLEFLSVLLVPRYCTPLGTKRIDFSHFRGLYEVVMHCLKKCFYFHVLEYDQYLICMKEMDIYNFCVLMVCLICCRKRSVLWFCWGNFAV